MELIEKALAKARAQAPATAPQPADPGTPASPPVLKQSTAAVPVPKSRSEVGTISYSRTQSSPVASQVWEQNRLVAHLNDSVADLFRILRTKVLQPMRENG